MVGLLEIQDYMNQHLEKAKEHRNVKVSGENLQDALKQASIELGLPLKKIDYEIIDSGSQGILGMNKKPCQLLAYPSFVQTSATLPQDSKESAEAEVLEDTSVNGRIEIRREPNGVMMKVTAPEKGGLKITEQDAVEILNQKSIQNADMALVSKLVKKADDFFVKIASFSHDPAQDAVLNLDIQDMEMSAHISITPPGEKGADVSYDAIVGFLNARGVSVGLLEDMLGDIANSPVYYQPILVAQGIKVKNGTDGKIDYDFQIKSESVRLREINGKVDFKDLDKINNVVTGQVLATLVEPTIGQDGKTVTGQLIPSHNGKPMHLDVGDNVSISPDGLRAIADTNGQALLLNNKIAVEPVFIVNNGVNLKTGNVLFLGTVLISGNVEDGFSVKASGNIEITGSVGKCELDAEGDIIIRQGMNGRDIGTITAGGDVYAKFIQSTTVNASGIVVVSDGIIGSHVSSDRKILCKGKRASIVGGSLRAAEEINAKALGSVVNVETVLEVGFDPKSKAKLDSLHSEDEELSTHLDALGKDIAMLERLRRTKRKLPPDRMARYKALKSEEKEYSDRRKEIIEEQETIHAYLNELKTSGKISASRFVYPGVKVSIKDASLEVRNEFRQVTFVNENNLIKVTKYEDIEEDVSMAMRRI